MQQKFQQNAEQYTKRNRGRRIWRRFVRVMAGFVVFCTTYALILPAITMEQTTFCGYEEHAHTEACYIQPTRPTELICSLDSLDVHVHTDECLDESGSVICGQADYIAHTHNDGCYDMAGTMVCDIPEAKVHEHAEECYTTAETTEESHTHIDDCYNIEKGELTCTTVEQEAHAHEDTCYAAEKALICQLAETEGHTHGEGCSTMEKVLTCTTTEAEGHTHGEGCSDAEGNLTCELVESEGHAHSDTCYTEQSTLTCTTAEQEAHTHGDSCYEIPVICGLVETEGHAHTDECSAWTETVICGLEETPIPEPELTCTAPIALEHIHGDGCFRTAEELPLTCELEESEEHTHDFLCYGNWELICPTEEHSHELICFSDPEADVETADVWEQMFENVELTGLWADDVVTIAKTQLGYTESEKNYEVLEDGETVKGYTRYGAWYGEPYADWAGMFASFAIRYAGVPEKAFPVSGDFEAWIADLDLTEEDRIALKNNDEEDMPKYTVDMFFTPDEYTPKAGDVVFFDFDEDGISDHMGLITELIEKPVETESSETSASAAATEAAETAAPAAETEAAAETTAAPAETEASESAETVEVTEAPETTAAVETTEVTEAVQMVVTGIKVIEGDSDNRVQYRSYKLDDDAIVGYGSMPENPNYVPEAEPAATEATEATEVTEATEPAGVSYTYSDDTLYVEVLLPEDTEVPEDAVLKVTPIDSTDEKYEGLAVKAEEAVDGTVVNVLFYDISFYTADDEYISVSDTAQVSMAFKESPVNADSEIRVLHFEEEEAAPAVLEEVNLEQKEIEMVLDDVQQAQQESGAAALEEEALSTEAAPAEAAAFSLRSVAETEPAEETTAPTEAEVATEAADTTEPTGETEPVEETVPTEETTPAPETVTEFRTVIQFTTNGFSTFAVVEVQTTTIVTGVTGLAGKDFVIAAIGPGNRNEVVLTSDAVQGGIADQNMNKPGLAGAQVNTNEVVLGDANNDGVLESITAHGDTTTAIWQFEAVPGNDTAYYIKSLKQNQYLHVVANEMTLAAEKQAIEVVPNDAGYVGLRVLGTNTYVNLCKNNVDSDFTGLANTDLNDTGNHMELWEVNSGVLTNLGGKSYVITAVNINDSTDPLRAMSSDMVDAANLAGVDVIPTYNDTEDTVLFVNAGEDNSLVWAFEAVNAAQGQYRIKSVESGQYLQSNAVSVLTTVAEQNAATVFTAEKVEVTVNGDVTNGVVSLVGNGNRVNLVGNSVEGNFSSWNTGREDRGNQLILSEYDGEKPVVNLDGQKLAIISVRDTVNGQNNNQPDALHALTSDVENNRIQGQVLTGATLNLQAGISTITDPAIGDNGYWTFEAVDAAKGEYRIKSSTNQYMTIPQDGQAGLTDDQNVTIVVSSYIDEDGVEVVTLRQKGTDLYLNRYGGPGNTGYAGYNDWDDAGARFVLARPYGFKATVLSRAELRDAAMMPNAQLIFFVRQTVDGVDRYYAMDKDGNASEIYLESDTLADGAIVYTTTTAENIRWDATGSPTGGGWNTGNNVDGAIDLWPKNLDESEATGGVRILCPNQDGGYAGNDENKLSVGTPCITSMVETAEDGKWYAEQNGDGSWTVYDRLGQPVRGQNNAGFVKINKNGQNINEDIASMILSRLGYGDAHPDTPTTMTDATNRLMYKNGKFVTATQGGEGDINSFGVKDAAEDIDNYAFYVAMVDTTGLLEEVESDKTNVVAQIMTRGEFMDAADEYSADYPFIIFATDGDGNYYAMDAYGKAQPINYVKLPEDGNGETYWEAGDKLIFQVSDADPINGEASYNANRVLWDASATQYQPDGYAEDYNEDNWIDLWLSNKATGQYLNPGPNGLTIGGMPDEGEHNPGFFFVQDLEGYKDPEGIASYLAAKLGDVGVVVDDDGNSKDGETLDAYTKYHVELDPNAKEFKVVSGWSEADGDGGTLGGMDGAKYPELVFYIAMVVDWNVNYNNDHTVSEYNFVPAVAENVEMHLFNYGSAIDYYGAIFNNIATGTITDMGYTTTETDERDPSGNTKIRVSAADDASNLLYRFFHRIPFKAEAIDGTNEANAQYITTDPSDGSLVYQRKLGDAGYPIVDLAASTANKTRKVRDQYGNDTETEVDITPLTGTFSLQYLFDKTQSFVQSSNALTIYQTRGSLNVNDGIAAIPAPDDGSDVVINANDGTTAAAGAYNPIVNPNYATQHYRVGITNADGTTTTGLFQRNNEGYFFYDGRYNAAWYDEEAGIMRLQNYTVFPADASDDQGGNYLPFNVGHTDGRYTPDAVNTSGTRRYTLNGFTQEDNPVTGRPSQTDLWFGMTLEFEFEMTNDGTIARKNAAGQMLNANGQVVTNPNDAQRNPMEFAFSGDDDVLVYIDDVLVLDIGGIHAIETGTINFQTGVVNTSNNRAGNVTKASDTNEDGKITLDEMFDLAGVEGKTNDATGTLTSGTHKLTFFYMERGGNISDCAISFNLEPKEKGGLSITKEIEGLSKSDAANYDAEFTFQLVDIVQPWDVELNNGLEEFAYTLRRADGSQIEGSLQLYPETIAPGVNNNTTGQTLTVCRYYLPENKNDPVYVDAVGYLGADNIHTDSLGDEYVIIYRYYDSDNVAHFYYNVNGVYTEGTVADGTSTEGFYVEAYTPTFTLGAYDTIEFQNLIAETQLKVMELETKNGVELGTSYWWRIIDEDDGTTQEGSAIGKTIYDSNGNPYSHISNEFWVQEGTNVTIRCKNKLSPVNFGIRKVLYDNDGETVSDDTTTDFHIKYTIQYPDSNYIVLDDTDKLYNAEVDSNGAVIGVDSANNPVKQNWDDEFYQYNTATGEFLTNDDGTLKAPDGTVKISYTDSGLLREYQTNTWTLWNGGVYAADGLGATPVNYYGRIVDTYGTYTAGDADPNGNVFQAKGTAEGAPDVQEFIWTVNVPFGSIVTVEELYLDGELMELNDYGDYSKFGYEVSWAYEGWDVINGVYQKVYPEDNIDLANTTRSGPKLVTNTSGTGAQTNGIKLLATDNYFTIYNRPMPDVTVEKTVEGEDKTEIFNFTYVVKDKDGNIVLQDTEGFNLGNGGTHTIYNIPIGGSVEVIENTDGLKRRYSTSYEIYSRYEAEDAVLSGATARTRTGASNGKAVNGIGGDTKGSVTFAVNTQMESAPVTMEVYYDTAGERSFQAKLNNTSLDSIVCTPNGGWDTWPCPDPATAEITLTKGANTIWLGNDADAAPNLDYIDIVWDDDVGTTASLEGIVDPVTIHFTNDGGYTLPMTGGTGTYLYTTGGVLLMMAALALLLYYHTKRGKEDYASS